MSKPTTDVASSEVQGADSDVSNNPELLKLEQAITEAGEDKPTENVSEEQVTEDASEDNSEQALKELAEKKGFKSVEHFIKWNENLEKKNTQLSQEMRELSKKIEKVIPKQKKESPYSNLPPEQRQALELLRGVVKDEISRTIQPLREDLEVRKAGQEIESVKSQFPGVSETDLNEAISIVENNPSLSLDNALKIVTYEESRRSATVKKKKAVQAKQKTKAFVESANTSKNLGGIDYSKLSLEEMEAIIPKAGQFLDHRGKMRK